MTNDPQQQPVVTPTTAPAILNAPDAANPPTPATTQPTAASGAQSSPASPVQPVQPPQSQPVTDAPNDSNDQQPGTVSNTPAITASHPAVQRAGLLHTIAEALAGGPRYSTTIDPNTGDTVRTKIPLRRSDIGMAIALEAISGALGGLVQTGPNATAKAAAVGFQQGQARQQQIQQQQEQQAQQDASNKATALVRQAQAFEANSRTILNSATSERQSLDSMKDYIGLNASLLQSYQDAGAVQESHVSQDSLQAGLASNKYSALTQIAVPDGVTTINGRPELTYSVVENPNAKSPLSPAQAQMYGDAGIQGWLAFAGGKTKVPQGYEVPGTMIADANNKLAAINLMKTDFASVEDALSKSPDKANRELAAGIPSIHNLLVDKDNGPALQSALLKFQRYVSHSDWHGMDLYESLQQMAAPSKLDPNTKQYVPNPDSRFASTIADALGGGDPQKGWAILKAYHAETTPPQITNENQATAVLSDPNSSSKAKVQARNFLSISQQQKAATARADAQAKKAAEGTGSGTPSQFATEQPVNGVRQNYLNSLPAEHRSLVQSIGQGLVDPAGRLLYRKDGQQIMQEVTTAYPGYDFSRAPEYAATRKAFTSGKTADAINALNTAMGHMLTMYQNASLGGSLPVIGGVERAAGNQPAINLANAKTALVDELGKAYKAGALTDQDVKSWKARIDAWSPAEIKGNAVSFVQLLDSKLSSYEQQWKNGSPPGAVAPIQILSPEARNAYQLITGRKPLTGSGLTNIQVNPQTHQQIGWDGSQWVDITTRQPVR